MQDQVLVDLDLPTVETNEKVSHSKNPLRGKSHDDLLHLDAGGLHSGVAWQHPDPDRTSWTVDDPPFDRAEQTKPLLLQQAALVAAHERLALRPRHFPLLHIYDSLIHPGVCMGSCMREHI